MRGLALLLWTAGAAIVWAVHFAAIYGLTALACARGYAAALGPAGVAGIVTGLGVLAAAAIAWLLRAGPRRSEAGFERGLGTGIAALALLAIALETLPAWLVPPCA